MRASTVRPPAARQVGLHARIPTPGPPVVQPESPAFDRVVPVPGLLCPDRSAGMASRTTLAAAGPSGRDDGLIARFAAPMASTRREGVSFEHLRRSGAGAPVPEGTGGAGGGPHVCGSNQIGQPNSRVIRRKIGFEYELDSIRTRHTESVGLNPMKKWVQHDIGDRLQKRSGYDITADIGEGLSRVEFVTDAFDEQTELAQVLTVIQNIRDDIDAMRRASLAQERKGYGAGKPWGGEQGWFSSDRWVGLNEIPRLKGDWWHQVEYAARPNSQLVGQLQMTAGFTIEGLYRLVSGEQLGNVLNWPPGWKSDVRQYLTSYARVDVPSDLFQYSLDTVRKVGLALDATTSKDSRKLKRAENGIAAVLSVMTHAPIAYRNAGTQAGLMMAKTDYAKILAMVTEQTGVVLDAGKLLAAVLTVVNRFVASKARADSSSPVFPQPDLDNVDFGAWIAGLVPQGSELPPTDLMTGANYPGTPIQKTGMRAYGPYGGRADPGGKAIFELRQLMRNPVTDLLPLAENLAAIMSAINMETTS